MVCSGASLKQHSIQKSICWILIKKSSDGKNPNPTQCLIFSCCFVSIQSNFFFSKIPSESGNRKRKFSCSFALHPTQTRKLPCTSSAGLAEPWSATESSLQHAQKLTLLASKHKKKIMQKPGISALNKEPEQPGLGGKEDPRNTRCKMNHEAGRTPRAAPGFAAFYSHKPSAPLFPTRTLTSSNITPLFVSAKQKENQTYQQTLDLLNCTHCSSSIRAFQILSCSRCSSSSHFKKLKLGSQEGEEKKMLQWCLSPITFRAFHRWFSTVQLNLLPHCTTVLWVKDEPDLREHLLVLNCPMITSCFIRLVLSLVSWYAGWKHRHLKDL